MNLLKVSIGALLLSLPVLSMTTGCSPQDKGNGDVTIVDMLAELDRPDFSETNITDVRYALLDTYSAYLISENRQIMGVIGDTVIIHDNTNMGGGSRLLLFDADNGHLIREISHIGQGPGEYSWIMNVVTDRKRGELILLTGGAKAHRYTTGDRYIESYDMGSTHGGKLPVGSAELGINETDAYDGNLYIYQYDDRVSPVDTLVINDYEPKWISIAFNLSDKESLINIVDTVYSLVPGGMIPVAVLSRGSKALTPEVERKVYIGRSDYEQAQKERDGYIEFLHFTNDGPRFSVAYSYSGRIVFDTYSHSSGKLISRRSFSYDDEDSGFPVPYESQTIHIKRAYPFPFLNDGRFYAIVHEDETAGSDGELSEDFNGAIISWRVEGE